MDMGVGRIGVADRAGGLRPEPAAQSQPKALIPCAADFPDDRPIFEARRVEAEPWVYEVWDIEHPAAGNHFPVLRVDSKGAADDLHFEVARICAEALNAHYAAGANRSRREEASAIEAATAAETTKIGSVHESAVAESQTPNTPPVSQ